MIFGTVGMNLFLASWILPPLIGTKTNTDDSGSNDDVGQLVDRTVSSIRDANKILHVVTTRFQQLQPHLVELGKARLELFETFCLPTMIRQLDVQHGFLWFVMTDPDLDSTLMQRLEQLLSPYPHFYLVASNEKLVRPAELVTLNQTTQVIRTGDIDLLYRQLFNIRLPLLIETRLDADDGLSSITLSEIQRMVLEDLPADTRGWQIICSRIHYEWRNNDITDLFSVIGDNDGGGDNISTNTDISTSSGPRKMSSGKIRVVREKICVTPGYTLVRHRPTYSIDFPPWPRTGHNLIVIEWPECSANDTSDNVRSYNCWKKLGNFPSAIRSRTITSAGMSRVAPPSKNNMYDNQTRLFWQLVERDFGILESKAISTSEYLQHNLPYIVEENLKGQW
jgi:hypothetical protein